MLPAPVFAGPSSARDRGALSWPYDKKSAAASGPDPEAAAFLRKEERKERVLANLILQRSAAEAEAPREAEAAILLLLLALILLLALLRIARVGQRGLLLLCDGDGQLECLTLTVDGELQRVARLLGRDDLDQIVAAGNLGAVHGVMMSLACRPACAAGAPSVTERTTAPVGRP